MTVGLQPPHPGLSDNGALMLSSGVHRLEPQGLTYAKKAKNGNIHQRQRRYWISSLRSMAKPCNRGCWVVNQ